ncbi:unnamed protein product [Cladocopium goreaui]|uniref:Polyamine oxidase 3 n=1 Tax=Cladocopium goreaui TaxID=2562237 RepID=A0A9P1CD58_9DINO|nr:unnamed protein product [Cladocopium goreaui]
MLAINQPGANIDNRGTFPYFMNVNKAWPSTNALLGFATGRYAIASEQKTDAEVQADFMSRIRQQFPNAPEPTQFKRNPAERVFHYAKAQMFDGATYQR